MPGQINPLRQYLIENITHVVFTTKFDAPIQSYKYIEPLGSSGDDYEIGRIAVTAIEKDGQISISYRMGPDDANCSFSSITLSNLDKKTFTLSNANFIKEGGGDRVELLDSSGKYIADAKIKSRSGNIIVLTEPVSDAVTLRLKISRLCVVLNGTTEKHSGQVIQNTWKKYTKFKDSSMDEPAEERIILS